MRASVQGGAELRPQPPRLSGLRDWPNASAQGASLTPSLRELRSGGSAKGRFARASCGPCSRTHDVRSARSSRSAIPAAPLRKVAMERRKQTQTELQCRKRVRARHARREAAPAPLHCCPVLESLSSARVRRFLLRSDWIGHAGPHRLRPRRRRPGGEPVGEALDRRPPPRFCSKRTRRMSPTASTRCSAGRCAPLLLASAFR